MQVHATGIEGLVEIVPAVYQDARGWFSEVYKELAFSQLGHSYKFLQDNISFSKKGVVRGLHLQLPPFAQAKLVGVLQGSVVDAVVDLRKNSSTFKKVFTCELSSPKRNFLLIPESFAHGFSALEDSLFYYKCTNYYSPAYESGIRWDDADLGIDWKVTTPELSEKDLRLPSLKDLLLKSVI